MPFSNGPLKCGMVANPSQGKVVILSCLTNTDLVNTNTPLWEQNFQRRAWQLRAFLFRYCGWLALWTTFWKNGGARVNETQLYGQHCQVWTCTALGEFFFFFFPLMGVSQGGLHRSILAEWMRVPAKRCPSPHVRFVPHAYLLWLLWYIQHYGVAI